MSPANVDKIQMQTDISTVAHSSKAPASISCLSVPHPLVLPRFTSSKEEERRWTWGRHSKRKQSHQQCRRIKENNKIYGSLGKTMSSQVEMSHVHSKQSRDKKSCICCISFYLTLRWSLENSSHEYLSLLTSHTNYIQLFSHSPSLCFFPVLFSSTSNILLVFLSKPSCSWIPSALPVKRRRLFSWASFTSSFFCLLFAFMLH